MNREIRESVMEEYRLRREENSREEARREREVFDAHPDIAEMYRERHRWILDGISGILAGDAEGGLEEAMARRNLEIGDRLAACGYPRNYLEPVYTCPLCRDTGYTGDVPRRECACMKARIRELEASRDPAGASFENFDLSVFPNDKPVEAGITQRRYMAAVLETCRSFADSYPAGGRNLVLHGSTGLGKTYLLRCVEKRLSERGVDTVYVTAYRLLDDLKNASFRPGSRDTDPYFACDLLIVDDLGMEPLYDNITVEMLLNVLNERAIAQKGVAVSTNLTLNELKTRYTERFYSRLMDRRNTVRIPFYGEDVRLM